MSEKTEKSADIGITASAFVTAMWGACNTEKSVDERIQAGHDAEDYLIELIRAVVQDMQVPEHNYNDL